MIPRIATVAGPVWESELVDRARLTGSLRITQRAFHPAQVHQAIQKRRSQAVLVGVDIPWLSAGLVATWRDMGVLVMGVDDPYHPPAGRLLEDWGCDVVLSDPDPEWVASVIRTACPAADRSPVGGRKRRVVAVGGPRGAPGRTEVALGLAWLAARTGSCLLVEADNAPGLGLRLGLPPPPSPHRTVTTHGVDLLLWSPHRSAGGLLTGGWSRMHEYETTVVDLGPSPEAFEKWPGERVVVCDARPSGIVRAACFLGKLNTMDPSWLIVNRLPAEEPLRGQILIHMEDLAGKRLDAQIGILHDLEWGKPPPASIQTALEPLMNRPGERDSASLGGPVAAQHPQVADGNQVRVEHFGQPFRSGGMDQVHEETVAPGFGGGTGFYPGEIGAAGRQFG